MSYAEGTARDLKRYLQDAYNKSAQLVSDLDDAMMEAEDAGDREENIRIDELWSKAEDLSSMIEEAQDLFKEIAKGIR